MGKLFSCGVPPVEGPWPSLNRELPSEAVSGSDKAAKSLAGRHEPEQVSMNGMTRVVFM